MPLKIDILQWKIFLSYLKNVQNTIQNAFLMTKAVQNVI